MRHRWIYVNGEAIPVDEYEPEATVHVLPDMQPYQSMVDGSMVMGRRQHREHLKAHGVIEVGNENAMPKPARVTGQKEALIHAVQKAKERYGHRHVESAISDALNRASERRR